MAETGLIISHLFQKPSAILRRLADEAKVWSIRKVPEPEWLAGADKKRTFHWGLGPVEADFKKTFQTEGLDRYLSENRIDLFSFDLGPAARRHLGILPLSRPLGREAIFRHTASSTDFIRRYYQGPLAVENYNFYPTGLYGHITQPGFIRDYLDEFGFRLVLDLAHGAVTAHNTGLAPEEYFDSLPLEKVTELHISRPFIPASPTLPAADAHGVPGEREWKWLEGLLNKRRIPAQTPVFIEYYKKAAGLAEAQRFLSGLVGP